MTGSLTRLLAALCTAIGLIAGGFEAHLAPQSDGWWHGVTGAPSPTLITLALVAAVSVWLLGSVVSVKPFLWMGAGVLPFVPATLGVAPALLIFSGYSACLLFAVLVAFTSRDLVPRLSRLEPGSAFVISFAFFLFVGRFLPGPAGPQGDEPHYLLIAESLLRDGDVDLKNQFEDQAYLKFTSAAVEPHTAPRSPKDRLYAIHAPGLSALVAPGYALSGYRGARAMVSVVMAAVVSLLFFVSRSLFGAGPAQFVFLLATFASPLPIYANSVFPDSVATLPVALTLAFLVSGRPALLGLASASIAALPWLHPRFLPLAGLLSLSMSARGGFDGRRIMATFGPLSLSLGLLLLHFNSLFGSASLSAAYGPGFSSDVSVTRIPWGAAALLLDRQFGLLLFAPVLLLGLPGITRAWRQDRAVAALLASVFVGTLMIGGAFSMWWGGASAPARFLIAAVPALLVICGACWEDPQGPPGRRGGLSAASGFGMGLLWLACLAPRALHNRADGESGLLRLLSPVLDADRFFPGFVLGDGAILMAGLWGLALTTAMLRPRVGLWLAVAPFTFGAWGAPSPVLNPFASSLRALESWTDHRRTLGGEDSDLAFTLEIPLGGAPWDLTPGLRRYSPRFSLPEGAWTMQVDSRTPLTPDATNVARVALVGDAETSPPFTALTIRAGEGLGTAEFNLNRGERRVHVRGEGLQATTRVISVRLRRQNQAP